LIGEKEKLVILGNGISDMQDKSGTNMAKTDYGYIIGVAYSFPQTDVILAANYKSKIKHKFENNNIDFYINSPSEIGIGLSWKIFGSPNSIGIDYKKIYSSKVFVSSGSALFTKDQNSFAIGYSYDTKKWSLRAGYKYISELYGENEMFLLFPFESKSQLET